MERITFCFCFPSTIYVSHFLTKLIISLYRWLVFSVSSCIFERISIFLSVCIYFKSIVYSKLLFLVHSRSVFLIRAAFHSCLMNTHILKNIHLHIKAYLIHVLKTLRQFLNHGMCFSSCIEKMEIYTVCFRF